MSECCASNQVKEQNTRRHICPANGKEYLEVPYKTVLHHLKEPWKLDLLEQRYYFCDDPGCDVVYFGSDNSIINKTSIRTKVGIKENSDDSLICYCFGVSRSEAVSSEAARNFVVEKTKKSLCACTIRHPSGRCCLKNFPE